ncbi:MAG: sulfatase, partial [Planctomycetota bacterium]
SPRPDVLLVTIDTLRRDAVTPQDMPTLVELAGRGTAFSRARSPVPLTLPAHVSLLSGLQPAGHGIRDNASPPLPEPGRRDFTLLAEEFQEAGYETVAFVASAVLHPRYRLDAGFDRYEHPPAPQPGEPAFRYLRAPEQFVRFLSWRKVRRRPVSGRRPFFCWVHLFDPHDPYHPYDGDGRRDATAAADPPRLRYRGEARRADAALERICREVDLERTIVVVCSDHGEGLGEHGEKTHGYLCYGSTLDVPLVLAGPGVEAGKADASRACSLVDVAPTLRRLCDLPDRPGAGRDLLGGSAGPRVVVSESLYAWRLYGWAQQTAAFDGGASLVDGGRRWELFVGDPQERRPVPDPEQDPHYERLDRALQHYRSAAGRSGTGAAVAVLTPYGSARRPVADFLAAERNSPLRDVRAAMPELKTLYRMRQLIALGQPEPLRALLPRLEGLAAGDPPNPAYRLALARARRLLGEYAPALRAAEAAWERGYRVPDVLKLIVVVAIQGGDKPAAERWFLEHRDLLVPEDRLRLAALLR